MPAYDIETYTERARSLLSDGPKTAEHLITHGMPLASIKLVQRNGVIRPKMQPWYNTVGRRIGAIEGWQMAPPTVPRRRREDCALMDFAEMGLLA
jgi:hypothetical protein